MKLISEVGGSRIYELEDGTHKEVRSKLYTRSVTVSKSVTLARPEIARRMAEDLVMFVRAWPGRNGHEGMNVLDLTTREESREVFETDEDGELLLDENSNPISTGEFFEVVILTAELGYWPDVLGWSKTIGVTCSWCKKDLGAVGNLHSDESSELILAHIAVCPEMPESVQS